MATYNDQEASHPDSVQPSPNLATPRVANNTSLHLHRSTPEGSLTFTVEGSLQRSRGPRPRLSSPSTRLHLHTEGNRPCPLEGNLQRSRGPQPRLSYPSATQFSTKGNLQRSRGLQPRLSYLSAQHKSQTKVTYNDQEVFNPDSVTFHTSQKYILNNIKFSNTLSFLTLTNNHIFTKYQLLHITSYQSNALERTAECHVAETISSIQSNMSTSFLNDNTHIHSVQPSITQSCISIQH